ncbi:MAG: class I tRNA ligase family protein, partial [bacterium]|nr:class I tRNA ligase family protein [bacterium]
SMQGKEIFQPMGFDAFGLPAENYAIKTGIHPYDSTMSNIDTMREQLSAMGASFDWDYEGVTCDPNYYKWTQWLFIKLFEAGLAYRKEAPVNWCPDCETVLANEQAVNGECDRCGAEVTKKNMTQWFFKITQYADELLDKLDELRWPEKTKMMQRNWIGRSDGAILKFNVSSNEQAIEVFTTRLDTLMGATYIVLAPEHPLVESVTSKEQRQIVEEYQHLAKKLCVVDRLSSAKEKTGVFTGGLAIHPVTGESIEIWIADYVLSTYGTGAVMAVPGHDARDYEFATIYHLPIVQVVSAASGQRSQLPYEDLGILVNSGVYNGLSSEDAKHKIVSDLYNVDGSTKSQIAYRLRDWLVSRQR